MARVYANVKVDIWNNDDFRDLSMPAQHLYLALVTDPDLSYCGVTDWRPRKMSGRAEAWAVEVIEMAACELLDKRFVLISEDTEEVLVRSFMRHDKALQNAKLSVSAANAIGKVGSNALRRVLAHELGRLHRDHPEWAAWKSQSILSALSKRADDPDEVDPFGPDLAPGLGRIWAKPEDAFGGSSGTDLGEA